jgi:trans-aconitate 2-methyltransferase
LTDSWDPTQYERFADERAQPFFDLLGLVGAVPGGQVVDLGCGTGELTRRLHTHTEAAATVGIDNSEAMLTRARSLAVPGLRFEMGDIADWAADQRYDVIFANASLHWLPDHPRLLGRLRLGLRSGGQLAVQVPANADHPSHQLAAEVALSSPFVEAMGGSPPPDAVLGVLTPAHYAELLYELGFAEQHVRLQVYGHRLASTADVAEWTKGSTLVRFRRWLAPDLFEAFVARYQQRLVEVLGDRRPYFYAFKRILLWGRLPGTMV